MRQVYGPAFGDPLPHGCHYNISCTRKNPHR